MFIVVLGGAGAMGKAAVWELVQNAAVERVVVADRRTDEARAWLGQLGSNKAVVCGVDIGDRASLAAAITGATAVVNCAWYEFNVPAMEACLAAGSHYVDLGGLYHVTKQQLGLHDRFASAGLSAVLGMGASPGMTNVCVGKALRQMDRVHEVHIRTGALGGKGFAYTARTILDELTIKPVIMTGGQIQELEPMSGRERYSLPEPVNEVEGFYAIHSELATLPQLPGIREITFRVAFSPQLVAAVDVLVSMGLLSPEAIVIKGVRISPREFLREYLSRFAESDDFSEYKAFRVEVKGKKGGCEIESIYEIAVASRPDRRLRATAIWTGIPAAVAAADFLARGKVPAGVYAPEQAFDPVEFIDALASRGLRICEHCG